MTPLEHLVWHVFRHNALRAEIPLDQGSINLALHKTVSNVDLYFFLLVGWSISFIWVNYHTSTTQIKAIFLGSFLQKHKIKSGWWFGRYSFSRCQTYDLQDFYGYVLMIADDRRCHCCKQGTSLSERRSFSLWTLGNGVSQAICTSYASHMIWYTYSHTYTSGILRVTILYIHATLSISQLITLHDSNTLKFVKTCKENMEGCEDNASLPPPFVASTRGVRRGALTRVSACAPSISAL